MKNILISGGSGFIGRHLTKILTRSSYRVFILTRNPHIRPTHSNVTYVQWLIPEARPETELPPIDAVVNLAGETINGRWTVEKKEKILHSRLQATEALLNMVSKLPTKPKVWLNASAIGYYGTSRTKVFTESMLQHGSDFLAGVVKSWETKASEALGFECRTVYMRFGLILGNDGGALPKLLLPYRFFAGGTVGSGRQWVSWVHIDDAVSLIKEAIANAAYEGPVNVTAPNPITMKEFGQTVGETLNKPHWLPVPTLAFKLLLGEMSMLMLEGQNVLPEKAEKNGFVFKYPYLKGALHDLIQ
jgi:uncharacterized protein